ncbi:hypothetical protein Q5752_003490 [Cryptotrichosporon argae]
MGYPEPGLPLAGKDAAWVPLSRLERQPRWSARSRLLPALVALALGLLIGMHYPLYLSVLNRRPQTIVSLLPPTLVPVPPSLVPPVSSLPLPPEPVPNIVHYVFGLDPDDREFPYYAYLAMRSAMAVLKPDRVLFHCRHEPGGYWWSRVFAHKADILRLEVLLQYGGIYLDVDTFVLRPFAPHALMMHDVVLGLEASALKVRLPMGDDEMRPKGLCNAVIVARPGAAFLRLWLASYDSFDERRWADHSVTMPWTLAQLYPTTVTVLSERAFHWPLWTPDHVRSIYEGTEYDFLASGQLTYHAWESKARPYLDALDPASITTIDTAVTRMAREFREPDEEVRWRAAALGADAGQTGISDGATALSEVMAG